MNNSKVDRVIELFREKKLYTTLKKPVALLIELILSTGATPIDIVNIQAKHINKRTNTLTLHIHKKKEITPTKHLLSSQAIRTFFSLKKPLHSYSIRRLQQLLKEETQQVGSTLTTARSLRKEYLKNQFNYENITTSQTQLISLQTRTLLSKEDQKKLYEKTYSQRNKQLILTLLETGLRVKEVLELHGKNLQEDTLIISKEASYNNQERKIPLPHILKKSLFKKGYLFSKQQPLTSRRFEQICKEVAQELSIEQLTPSILRATAIYNLSKHYSQKKLQFHTGLNSSTMYTHGFLATPSRTSATTQEVSESTDKQRKDQEDETASTYMYLRSKLKDGGDSDE